MKTEVKTETNLKVGGYNINPTTKIPRDALIAFKEATSGLVGAGYKPLILVGSQVVSGMNYKFIAEVTIVTPTRPKKLVEMEIYKPLNGKATIKGNSIKELVSERPGMMGGWKIIAAVDKLPQKVATAFPEIFSEFVGAKYSPLVYAASQLVSGTNHMIYCKQTKITNPTSYGLVCVILYENLEEKIIIQSVATIE